MIDARCAHPFSHRRLSDELDEQETNLEFKDVPEDEEEVQDDETGEYDFSKIPPQHCRYSDYGFVHFAGFLVCLGDVLVRQY